MEWIIRLNSAINYIEENLMDEIDMKQVAKIACCSTYHFQRMFAYMAGLPLSEYIRRRRMSRAAVDLQDPNNKVIDIALKYGYDSPTAFNRAFKGIHGITPSQVREEGTSMKAYPPNSFKMSIKGDQEMEYRIEKREAFRIIGVSKPLDKDLEKNFMIVPGMWGEAVSNGTIEQLATHINNEPRGLLGVSLCNDLEAWRYYIAVASDDVVDNFEECMIPEATWAIFRGKGTNQAIQELEKRIVTEWLPTSGYEYGNAPDIEVYINPDPNDAIFEVWIPVVRVGDDPMNI